MRIDGLTKLFLAYAVLFAAAAVTTGRVGDVVISAALLALAGIGAVLVVGTLVRLGKLSAEPGSWRARIEPVIPAANGPAGSAIARFDLWMRVVVGSVFVVFGVVGSVVKLAQAVTG